MKSFYIIIVLVSTASLYSCHSSWRVSKIKMNEETVDAKGNLILVGASTKSRLQETPFDIWFNKNYSDYNIDTLMAEELKTKLITKRFVIFMATWCGDSRQEVPKIYKILDYCGVPEDNIRLINLEFYDSVYKQSPGHEERGLNIHRVPNLLVYENETEIGRVIEKPIESWEKDILAIARGDQYVPRYKIVSYLQDLFKKLPEQQIEWKLSKIADSLISLVAKNEGLSSFGNVLLATNENRKALIVLRLNTMLYPTGVNGFISLADAYRKTGNKDKAIENYERVLSLEPGNEKASAMLAQLLR